MFGPCSAPCDQVDVVDEIPLDLDELLLIPYCASSASAISGRPSRVVFSHAVVHDQVDEIDTDAFSFFRLDLPAGAAAGAAKSTTVGPTLF